MVTYNVKNEYELEDKLQDVVAGNIIQFRKGSELKRYRIQYDGSYLPINSENTRNTRNTRKIINHILRNHWLIYAHHINLKEIH